MWLGIQIGFWTLFFSPLARKPGAMDPAVGSSSPKGCTRGFSRPPHRTQKKPNSCRDQDRGETTPSYVYYIWTLCTRSLHASLINLIDQFYSTLGHTNTQILTHTKAMGSPLNSIKFNWQKEMNMSMQKTKKHKKQMHVPHTLYSVHIVYHTIHEKQINGGTEHNG